jgi:glycosyltransferase involved in cell wall biosynthesis
MIVTLMDIWVLNGTVWSKLGVPWAAWIPIDAEHIGGPHMDRLKLVDFPIAMSDFGVAQMEAQEIKPFARIYHAVDTDVFYPHDKKESRKLLGIDADAYVIGMVMANKGDRKQFPNQLQGIRRWMDTFPDRDKVRVFLHTETKGRMGGWDIRELVNQIGLTGHIHATNDFDSNVVPLEDEMLATIYSCFDVLMNVSAGEGFGVPIVEAQACMVPVITGNWTAMPEITHAGYTVEAAGRGLAGHYGWQFLPDVDDIAKKLEYVYRSMTRQRRELGRQWVINNCSVPVIAAQWDEVLRAVGAEASLGAAAIQEPRPQQPELVEAITAGAQNDG